MASADPIILQTMEGFSVTLDEDNPDNLGLIFSDGSGEEKLWLSALELAEGLARLEESELLDSYDSPLDSQSLEAEDLSLEALLQDPPERSLEGAYRAAQVEVFEPSGLMTLRRIAADGEDTLEFTTPSGSVYLFDYDALREYLRPILPR